VVVGSGSREGTAYGAVIVAGVGLGVWPDFKAASELMHIETTNEPDRNNFELYDHYFSIYKSLYGLLRESFKKINQ
jgi:xylulokinase